jgi:hypothetical protein
VCGCVCLCLLSLCFNLPHWLVAISLIPDVILRKILELSWLYVFSSLNEMSCNMSLRTFVEMTACRQCFLVFHNLWSSWKLPFTGERAPISLTRKYYAFIDCPLCDPGHFLDESELICSSTLSEFLSSFSRSCQPLCAILCFDEVGNRQAWQNNIVNPSVVPLCPHKGISSGDGWCCSERNVVHPMSKVFSWLMEVQRAWVI